MTDTHTIPTLSAATAAKYTAHGWTVAPKHPTQKRPLIQGWQHFSSKTPSEVCDMWARHPSEGVCIVTGPASNLLVLDIDPKDGGDDTLNRFEDQHGELPATPVVKTPSGGLHYYFNYPDDGSTWGNTASKIGPGVDTRGQGGQVVAPPTAGYDWIVTPEEEPVADAPAWLLDLLKETPDTAAAPAPPSTPVLGVTVLDDRPGDRYNRDHDWATTLTSDGWAHHHTDQAGCDYWTRPGKDPREGWSATTGHDGSANLHVFTGSVPFLQAEEWYTPLGYLAARDHGGDMSAAARTLAAHNNTTVKQVDPGALIPATTGAGNSDKQPNTPHHLEGWETLTPQHILDILNGDLITPEPTILTRTDGTSLIYPGKIHSIAGEPGIGKTWLGLIAAAEQLKNNNHILFIDYEDMPGTHISRLLQLDIPPETIATNFHYTKPHETSGHVPQHIIDIATNCTLAIIDSVGEAISFDGKSQDSDDDVTTWHRNYTRPIRDQNCAVIVLDHVTKSADTRNQWAIGSQRKLAAIDGAAYTARGTSPTKGGVGTIKLTTAKDRHGTHPRLKIAAEIAMTSTISGLMDIKITPHDTPINSEGQWTPTVIMGEVSDFLADNPESSFRAIKSGIGRNQDHIKVAIQRLIDMMYVKTKEGPNRSILHSNLRKYESPKEPSVLDPSEYTHRTSVL